MYGVCEEICADGGPQFISGDFKVFLENWGCQTSSFVSRLPQSNRRAELGVKASKRIIAQNTAKNGSLDTDRAAKETLQYRNTPLPELGLILHSYCSIES